MQGNILSESCYTDRGRKKRKQQYSCITQVGQCFQSCKPAAQWESDNKWVQEAAPVTGSEFAAVVWDSGLLSWKYILQFGSRSQTPSRFPRVDLWSPLERSLMSGHVQAGLGSASWLCSYRFKLLWDFSVCLYEFISCVFPGVFTLSYFISTACCHRPAWLQLSLFSWWVKLYYYSCYYY